MRWLLLAASFLLCACDNNGVFLMSTKEVVMNPLSEVKTRLAFECAHERFPGHPGQADILFQYARWLQKNNQLRRDETVNAEIERLYRVASEHDHYKASINLQNGSMRGDFTLHAGEYLRFSQRLIDADVATGYYFLAIFLNRGAAGLKQDQDTALRYYRKAADEGSALAQYYVGKKLVPKNIAPEVAFKMYQCAAEQGHGGAAVALGMHHKRMMNYQDALKVFQLGVAAGNEVAALVLKEGFSNPLTSDRLNYLGQEKDIERAERYKKIGSILSNYSYANPTVPEINEIVPLPPAKLPPWDGNLQWLETRKANIPPEKPSEALIHKLAKEKVLDPATGKPMPGSPAFSKANFPVMVCASGQPCPQSGYWKVMINSWEDHIQHFEEGEIMPTYLMVWTEYRPWPLRDKSMQRQERVEWGLLG
ncbi:sel1 repeat family protein [Pseudomonas sp. NPDC089395]|uniref:SEL1-like repeat protein n=1 Tax=Pseudomonas sp. NPDC089395 TaxID=3364460 RepID=UPI00381A6823